LAASLKLVRTDAPLYRDVATALERAIRDGVWKAGDQIPTEADLEARFHASRGTLRMAVSELVRKGLLHRQPGRGTFVLGPTFDSLERYFRYERLAGDDRIQPRNAVLDQHALAADDEVAAALGVAPGSDVAFLRRLRFHQEEPFLLVDSYFHPDAWALVSGADFSRHPLYDVFKNEFGLYVVSADEFLRASLASDVEAQLLQVERGNAVIRLERTAFTFAARPIEYRRAVGRADRFRYHVRLQ
jgi:GntR family transcriptional regulator